MLESILSIFVPVHREGYRFIAIFAGVSLAAFVLLPDVFGWLGVILTLWCGYFFRDPERVTPLRDGLVISPADGRISSIGIVDVPPELEVGSKTALRISVFMNVFDVHVNRAPVAGEIAHAAYIPGKFLNAELDKASEDNERQAYAIETEKGYRVGVVQIAGLVARRIVKFVDVDDRVQTGQRFGLIRFGSRVDVYLPDHEAALVSVGQRAVAGETVLADLQSREPARTSRLS